MRLAVAAIAASFAGGILLGQSGVFLLDVNTRGDLLIALVVVSGSVLIAGVVLTWLWLGGAAPCSAE